MRLFSVVTLFFFVSSLGPNSGFLKKNQTLSAPSQLIPGGIIRTDTPERAVHSFIKLGTAAMLFSFIFAPSFLPASICPVTVQAQDAPANERLDNLMKSISDDFEYMHNHPESSAEREQEIIRKLGEVKELNDISSIQFLLEMLKSTLIDYETHENLYEPILDTILHLLSAYKSEGIAELALHKYWRDRTNPNARADYIPFYHFPKNVRIGDIPRHLMEDTVRRLEMEARYGAQGDNIFNMLDSQMAAQSFRLYTRAHQQGLPSGYDPNLLVRAVESAKIVVGRFIRNDDYIKKRIIFGLIQSFENAPLDPANRESTLRAFASLKQFAYSDDFKRVARPERFIERTEAVLIQRLIMEDISLHADELAPKPVPAPEAPAETKPPKPKEEIKSPNYLLFGFLAAISFLIGIISSLFLIRKDKKKKYKFNRPIRGNGRVTLPFEQTLNDSDPYAQQKPFPKLEPKQIGFIRLGDVVAQAPEGYVRKAVLYNTRPPTEKTLIEKGRYFIEYPMGSSSDSGRRDTLYDGTPIRTIYYYEGANLVTARGAFRGDFAVLSASQQNAAIGQASDGSQNVPFTMPVFDVYRIEDGTRNASQFGKFILSGDLLIRPTPDPHAESIAKQFGPGFKAYSISEFSKPESKKKSIIVTPFIVNTSQVYWLTEKLGQGGMGAVYKAWDPNSKRYVAIKIILGEDAEGTMRFGLETLVTAKLSHPNIVKIHRSGASPRPFFVMDYLDGPILQNLDYKSLILEQLLEIGIQAAEGLEYIHKRNVLHRDLKPENLFWVNGRVVFTDFGLALEAERERLTQTGSLLGTPDYMSPEQAKGKASEKEMNEGKFIVDQRTDIYAMGLILYFLATGVSPLKGKTTMASLINVTDPSVHKAIKPMSAYRRGIPNEFEVLVRKAKAFEVEERFQSAEELKEALLEIRKKLRKRRLSPIVAYRTKQITKWILIVSAVLGALIFSVPFYLKWRSQKQIQAPEQPTAPAPEPEEKPTLWSDLNAKTYSEAMILLEREIPKLKPSDQAVQFFYRAKRKWDEARRDPGQVNYTGLLHESLSDLNRALEILAPLGVDLKVKQIYLLKIKVMINLGQNSEAVEVINRLIEALEQKEENDFSQELRELKQKLESLIRSIRQVSLRPMPRQDFGLNGLLAMECSA